jgi:glycine betaine/proline transport system ATP-binding protein
MMSTRSASGATAGSGVLDRADPDRAIADRAATADGAGDSGPIKIACRKIWKLFGRGAEEFLARGRTAATLAELTEAGLIGAVRAAAIDVRQGEIFVIMGLSGSGKSTLVRCLSRLIEPTAGEIIFEGRDLLKASSRELIEIRRHKMGMVFQHFALLPHRTVLGNVSFPLEVQGIGRAERDKRAMTMIELVGLKGREHYFPRQLSGGQQQRVGIARSLAIEPEIWFLDEPFSALDPLIRREMQDEFLRLQSVVHKTIVFITHDFDEAIRLADRIAIMKDGEIIQLGTPEALVTDPATDYVAEFTRDVQRAKVISARTLMTPAPPGAQHDGQVRATARVASFAGVIVGATRPFAVLGANDAILGQVSREAVIDVLAGRKNGR